MRGSIITIAMLATTVLLAGCEAGLTKKKPITAARVIADDNKALFTAVAVETDRRLLIIDERDQTVCGERPSDAQETYSSDFADQIGRAVRKGKVDADTATAMVAMFDSAVDDMDGSTQGIKYARDQMYFLCISRQNSYITNEQYLELTKEVIAQSSKLVALEIPTLRSANQAEIIRMRDYLQTSLETGEELAEAMADVQKRRNAREQVEDDD